MSCAADPKPHPLRVDIYVAEACPICQYAFEVAMMIRDDFPMVEVRFTSIGEPNVIIPENVFATPTYLLNGDRWSLGNPSPERVRAVLTAALGG